MKRRLETLGWTLVWLGLFVFGYLGYQLYFTDVLNARSQTEAKVAVRNFLEGEQLPPREVAPEEEEVEPVVHYPEDAPEEGTPFGVIRIPKIGVDVIAFEGVTVPVLREGPGHMPGTAFPGQPGNAVVSGHRTTFGRPFFDLDQLAEGDLIEVETAVGVHTYQVRWIEVVLPTDVWVAEHRPGAWLTLTTCEPKFSARQRLIIAAELVDGLNLEYARFLEDGGETAVIVPA